MSARVPESWKRVPRIIQGALILSVLMYPFVIWVITRQQAEPEHAVPEDLTAYVVLAAGVAAVMLAMAFWLPGFLASDERIMNAMRGGDPNAPLGAGVSFGEVGRGSHPYAAAVSLLFTGFILRLALLEAIALAGLVLSLLVWDPLYAVVFAVVALVLMLSVRFDTERLERLYRRVEPEFDRPEEPV